MILTPLSDDKKKNSWKVESKNGMISLEFTASVSKEEKVKLIVIESEFVQSCGRYTGHIVVDKMHFKVDCMGVFEDHYALW